MSKFIIVGNPETQVDLITELIHNIHFPYPDNIEIEYSFQPVVSENNNIIYINISPADLWDLMSNGNMSEENRRKFNDYVVSFARYENYSNKTFKIIEHIDLYNLAIDIWNYIRAENIVQEEIK